MNDILNIRNEFSKFTGLRHSSVSEKSGEEFYHSLLNERFIACFKTNGVLTVDLDGNRGYSPSFIDESFGNLVFDFELSNVKKHLIVKSQNFKFWEESVKTITFPLWERKRIKNELPKKTKLHGPWWKIVKGGLEQRIWIYPETDAV